MRIDVGRGLVGDGTCEPFVRVRVVCGELGTCFYRRHQISINQLVVR